MGHLTDEEKAKIIEEEELRSKTRQKVQNEYDKENEYSKNGILSFYWFDDSPLGQLKSFGLTVALIFIGSGIAYIFR